MKCISIIQPWASLILLGEKQYETRNPSTPYRGPLLIHASKGMPPQCVQFLEVEPFRSILVGHDTKGVNDLPQAAILGRVELVDCVRTEFLTDLTEQEKAFGNFAPGCDGRGIGQFHRWQTRPPGISRQRRRNGHVIAIACAGDEEAAARADEIIYLPEMPAYRRRGQTAKFGEVRYGGVIVYINRRMAARISLSTVRPCG